MQKITNVFFEQWEEEGGGGLWSLAHNTGLSVAIRRLTLCLTGSDDPVT